MHDPRVPLKNPFLAVCLGLLFPGAGHLYQGRTFKGASYAVCIVGTLHLRHVSFGLDRA